MTTTSDPTPPAPEGEAIDLDAIEEMIGNAPMVPRASDYDEATAALVRIIAHARTLRAQVATLEKERDEARAKLRCDGTACGWKAECEELRGTLQRTLDRAHKAERERDETREVLVTAGQIRLGIIAANIKARARAATWKRLAKRQRAYPDDLWADAATVRLRGERDAARSERDALREAARRVVDGNTRSAVTIEALRSLAAAEAK